MAKRTSAAANGQDHRSETHKKLVRLRELAGSAKQNLYQRCKLATEVLADDQWIAAEHEGDFAKAQKAIEDNFFSDVAGFVVLSDLLKIFKQFSEESQWKELRYNLAALRAAMREATKEAEPTRAPVKRATLAQVQELEEELANVKHRSENASRTISGQAEEITALKDRIAELERENAELRRQLAEKTGRRELAAVG